MDTRFTATPLDFTKNTAVFLHPTASIESVRNGYVQPPVFTGTGQNDMSSSGTYNGAGNAIITVTIDGTGTTHDTFSWALQGTEGGATGVPILGVPSIPESLPGTELPPLIPVPQDLGNGVIVTFGLSSGHTLGDKWVINTASDAVDLSPYLSAGSQSFWEVSLTLNWNNELFGTNQPKPNQIIEIQQQGITAWLGIIENIGSYTISRGSRQMEVVARSRDSLNLWRETKYTTRLYPKATALTYIVSDIGTQIGLVADEVIIDSPIITAHTNTQLSGMSAWDMFTTVFMAMGFTPFVDCLGRLRGANRDLARTSDVVLTSDRIIQVKASRVKAPTSRFRLMWLDPVMSKSIQTGRKLADAQVLTSALLPWTWKTVNFSQDQTLFATAVWVKTLNPIHTFTTMWEQDSSDGKGVVTVENFGAAALLVLAYAAKLLASKIPEQVVVVGIFGGYGATIPLPRIAEALCDLGIINEAAPSEALLEIWGNPYKWIHAKNTTETFDQNSPQWVDNPAELENDFITDQDHSNTVAVRELKYRAFEVNKWEVEIWEDLRLEFGDILELPDGSKLFVEDISRSIQRDSNANMSVKGFMINTSVGLGVVPLPSTTSP